MFTQFTCYFFFYKNLYKLKMKNQSYPKSAKIDAFEQKICKCHNLTRHFNAF